MGETLTTASLLKTTQELENQMESQMQSPTKGLLQSMENLRRALHTSKKREEIPPWARDFMEYREEVLAVLENRGAFTQKSVIEMYHQKINRIISLLDIYIATLQSDTHDQVQALMPGVTASDNQLPLPF